MKVFKNLSEVKRNINIGDSVIIRNYMRDELEERKVTGKNTVGITTYSPSRIDYRKSKFIKGEFHEVLGADVILNWQKASETRVVKNKVQFLANENNCDKHLLEHLNEMNLDYWLELEIL